MGTRQHPLQRVAPDREIGLDVDADIGVVADDAALVLAFDGKPVNFKTPIDARRAGIETVYQDLAVAPAMSIAENLFLGRELRRPGLLGSLFRMLDKKRMQEESIARMQDLKVGIRSMSQAVETLSGGQRQCVAVARAAAFAQHVVITVAVMTGAMKPEDIPVECLAQ